MRSVCYAVRKLGGLQVGLLLVALIALMITPGPSSALDGRDGNKYVNYHRDRLLDGYAQYKGLGNRVNAWNAISYKQKMLFLIQTDLLGNRTFMRPTETYYYKNNPNDGCGMPGEAFCASCVIEGGQRLCGGCTVFDPLSMQPPGCESVDAYACYQMGLCSDTPQQRTDWTMALEHVTKLYEILAPSDSCSGDDNNRIFWQAGTDSTNDALIQALRNRTMSAWGANGDIGGTHAPFDNASSTINGRPFSCDGPDGQAQFYSWDTVCTYSGQKGCSHVQGFWRGGVYLPADSRMFELDNDYNTFHDSSPLCSYCGGQYGVTMYQNHWCPSQGNFAQCDWNYAPTPVNYTLTVSRSGSGGGTVTSSPAGINCGATCTANFVTGSAVTLTASPAGGSTFAGWSGACSSTGTCAVSMIAAQSVTATFSVVVAVPQIAAVVDGTNYSYTVTPTTTITIFGSNFSIGGNIVHFQRAGYSDIWLYNGDGHYFWDYNGTQINASLDGRVASGTWNVIVRNASGWESAAYSLTIQNNAAGSSAYYCYSSTYPWYYYGFQNWLCNAAYHPTYCYTVNWQWTTCPSSGGGSSGSVCGNGTCEAGENGSNCPQDCCDQNTPCGQTKQNQGVYYCRNMYYYDWQTGTASWHGWQWVTAQDTTNMCNEWWKAQEGAWYQTQYQCGGYTGKCHSIPGGYY